MRERPWIVLIAVCLGLVLWIPAARSEPPARSRAIDRATPGRPLGTGGDKPLTTSFVDKGRVDVFVTAIPYNNSPDPSGRFTISGLPADATIRRALLYLTDWNPGFAAGSVSVTFGAEGFGPAGPISADPGGGLTLASYRFDVTAHVGGNGSYPYTSFGIGESYGAALVVVYSSPSLPRNAVWINDGGESMCCDVTSNTTFPGVQGGSQGRLIVFTEADDEQTTGEQILFNEAVVGGPIDANLGPYASLFDLPVAADPTTNVAAIFTPNDWFGWHLAILVRNR